MRQQSTIDQNHSLDMVMAGDHRGGDKLRLMQKGPITFIEHLVNWILRCDLYPNRITFKYILEASIHSSTLFISSSFLFADCSRNQCNQEYFQSNSKILTTK